MRIATSILLSLILLAACGANYESVPRVPAPVFFDLEALADGALPDGFEISTGAWIGAAAPDGARGLLQDAKGAGPDFNVVLAAGPNLGDLAVAVTVHPVSGEIDRGGGPVWRARDGRNYYVARWNPLEENFRAYKVVDGVRTQLASAAAPGGDAPREIRIRMVGARIEGYLDGTGLLEVTDATFPGPGRVGLWTKADARTLFAGLGVEFLAGGE